MIFALLTLLSALALAGVAGWFSIIGIMAIYAGATFHALVMGITLEAGKLVTTSWLYRNWDYSPLKLKIPLIVFTITLMIATSIGVFGFLSKAHLEQGAATIDNGPKIEMINQQIAREQSTISDDQKVINQLDATINSYLGKDRADRSVFVRRKQEPERKKLREDIESSQERIDQFNDQKFKLQSEVRKLQLDVGPIRYIAELIYGTDDTDKNIESAVRMFTLIIVSTLDPLAVILLIAANHTIMRRQNEKNQKTVEKRVSEESRKFQYDPESKSLPNKEIVENDGEKFKFQDPTQIDNSIGDKNHVSREEAEVHIPVYEESVENKINEEKKDTTEPNTIDKSDLPNATIAVSDIFDEDPMSIIRKIVEKKYNSSTDDGKNKKVQEVNADTEEISKSPIIKEPSITRVNKALTEEITTDKDNAEKITPWELENASIREIFGNLRHFIPKKVNEEEKSKEMVKSPADTTSSATPTFIQTPSQEVQTTGEETDKENNGEKTETLRAEIKSGDKYQKDLIPLSWLREFKRY